MTFKDSPGAAETVIADAASAIRAERAAEENMSEGESRDREVEGEYTRFR